MRGWCFHIDGGRFLLQRLCQFVVLWPAAGRMLISNSNEYRKIGDEAGELLEL